MLPTMIYVLRALRRALQKFGRGLLLVGEVVSEAQEARRTSRHRHMQE
jgi:hypothetical protein